MAVPIRLPAVETEPIADLLVLHVTSSLQSCEQRVYVQTEESQLVNTCWALLGLMAVRYTCYVHCMLQKFLGAGTNSWSGCQCLVWDLHSVHNNIIFRVLLSFVKYSTVTIESCYS